MGFLPKGPNSQEQPGDPIFEPGDGVTDPINDPTPVDYDALDPIFSFKSAEFNLKYNKLIPFIGIYLIYKFIL